MQLSLVMFTAGNERRDFQITKSRTVIGRQYHCDLRIPLSNVSREHCEIVIDDDVATLRDLGSSNGTYQNHKRVQTVHLSAGDLIVVGPVVFTVVKDGHPEKVSPVRTIVGDAPDQGGQDVGESMAEPAAEGGSGPASRPTPKPNPAENEEDDLLAEPEAESSSRGDSSAGSASSDRPRPQP